MKRLPNKNQVPHSSWSDTCIMSESSFYAECSLYFPFPLSQWTSTSHCYISNLSTCQQMLVFVAAISSHWEISTWRCLQCEHRDYECAGQWQWSTLAAPVTELSLRLYFSVSEEHQQQTVRDRWTDNTTWRGIAFCFVSHFSPLRCLCLSRVMKHILWYIILLCGGDRHCGIRWQWMSGDMWCYR